MASKGQKYKQWTAEEKYKIIKPALDFEKSTSQVTKETGLSNGMINNWIKAYRESGMEGLTQKKNIIIHYQNIIIRKNLRKKNNLNMKI